MAQQSRLSLEQLKEDISSEFSTVKGKFALAFEDLSDKNNFVYINENEFFHAASTMKTPVMIEVYKQANSGLFKLSDSVIIKNEFKSIVDGSSFSLDLKDDSGDELYNFIGQKKSIKELVHSMITVSSNLATNILIEIVGADNIMNTMKSIGADKIKILRGVQDIKAFENGLNNTTTAKDLSIIYKHLALGSIISSEASDEMIDILLDQKLNTKIPAKLPGGVKSAHKTGSITGIEHDSGIIILPDGRKYILVILSKELVDNKAGIKAIARVSRMVYDYMIAR